MFLRSEEVCSFEQETCIPSFGGGIFLRAGDVYSFGRRTFIPSDERDLSPEPVRMSHSDWCACPTRASVQVPLGRVGRCHQSECVGVTRASVQV